MKNVLVISTSLCIGSNSGVLAREFAKGARDTGNQWANPYNRET